MAFIEETTLYLIVFLSVFFAFIAGIILYFMYVYTWTEKRKIFYVKSVEGVYTVFRKHTIKQGFTKTEATIHKKTFTFDIGKPTYRNKNKCFYFVDVNDGQVWINDKGSPELSAKLLHATLKEEIGKQLVTRLDKHPFMGDVMMLVMGSIIGILGGYVLGNLLPMV